MRKFLDWKTAKQRWALCENLRLGLNYNKTLTFVIFNLWCGYCVFWFWGLWQWTRRDCRVPGSHWFLQHFQTSARKDRLWGRRPLCGGRVQGREISFEEVSTSFYLNYCDVNNHCCAFAQLHSSAFVWPLVDNFWISITVNRIIGGLQNSTGYTVALAILV